MTDLSSLSIEDLIKLRDQKKSATPSPEPVDLSKLSNTQLKDLYVKRRSQTAPDLTASRVAGLGGRIGVESAIEGVAGLPALAGDALYNTGVFGYNRFVNDEDKANYGLPVSTKLSELSSSAADAFGLPQPETETEKNVSIISKGALSSLTGAGAAKGLKTFAENSPRLAKMFGILADKPVTQAVAGGTAAGVTNALANNGYDPTTAAAMGILVGGVGVPAARSFTGAIVSPFSQYGQERIIGNTLGRFATDKETAIQNAKTAPTFVEGSQPTFAEASKDPGLLGLQSGLMRDAEAGPELGLRRGQQNNARVQTLESTAGYSPREVDAAKSALRQAADVKYGELLDTAEAQSIPVIRGDSNMTLPKAGPVVDLRPIEGEIKNTLASRSGARIPVQQAMNFALNELNSKVKDVGTLYSVRQNLKEALEGRYTGSAANSEMANMKLARKEIGNIISRIDDAIEQARPGYRNIQEDYKNIARPIDAAKNINEMLTSASKGVEDPVFQRKTITVAAFERELKNYKKEIESMSPQQQETLVNVFDDLQRSNAVNSSTIRAAGSDTFKNMSVASLLGKGLSGSFVGNTTVNALMKPLQWIHKLQEPQLKQLLTEAMMDPELGAKLLAKANPKNTETFSKALQEFAVRNFLTLGTVTSRSVSADKSSRKYSPFTGGWGAKWGQVNGQ